MLAADLEEAHRLAVNAGALLETYFGKLEEIRYKEPRDPVTDADEAVNAFVVERLEAAFPADVVVAEEGGGRSAPAEQAERVWYVDPLDGTKEFVSGRYDHAVMIGLALHGRAALGVVHAPLLGRTYLGVVGGGAEMIVNGHRERISVSDRVDGASLRLVQSRSRQTPRTDRLAEELGIVHRERRGSLGIKAGLVASGEADLYAHMTDRSGPWDTCGPEAIVRAAGGRVVDLSGAPIFYDPAVHRNERGVLVSNAACFDRVVAAARAVALEVGLLEAER